MKICKCVKCHAQFEMPDGFIGTILYEDCDPFMNKDVITKKNTSRATDREEFERGDYCEIIENVLYHPGMLPEQCSDITDIIVNNLKTGGYVIVEQKKIGALEAENPQVTCPACGGEILCNGKDWYGNESEYTCGFCNRMGTVFKVKAQEYRIKELEAEIDRLNKANMLLLEMVK